MCQALLEIMEPEINKIKETLREEVTKEVTKRKGISREIKKALINYTNFLG